MELADLYALRANAGPMRARVIAAVAKQAVVLLDANKETPDAKGAAWSLQALANPEVMADKMMFGVLADPTISQKEVQETQQGDAPPEAKTKWIDVTDAEIQAAVDRVAVAFAKGV